MTYQTTYITYSSNIIGNVSDSIIVFDQASGIKIFNQAAEKLFDIEKHEALSKSLFSILPSEDCQGIIENPSRLQQLNCVLGKQKKYLLISKSQFTDSDENGITILVIRDLTEQKLLEEQMERKQRLTAMGELASGVAHEIRNPLNTIGTIIQQLNKDFEPASDKEEYHELAGLVYNEVRRINDTVQDFLRFARPEPVQPKTFQISDLFNQLQQQYRSVLDKKKIEFKTEFNWTGEVFWDERQIKQVLINILQNAIDCIEMEGQILISVESPNNQELEIRIKDNGPGMTDEVRNHIFNLYFTTKAQGTGIGLSIVQRIIFEHRGVISVESKPGLGTTFKITLPIHLSK